MSSKKCIRGPEGGWPGGASEGKTISIFKCCEVENDMDGRFCSCPRRGARVSIGANDPTRRSRVCLSGVLRFQRGLRKEEARQRASFFANAHRSECAHRGRRNRTCELVRKPVSRTRGRERRDLRHGQAHRGASHANVLL